MRFTDHRVGLLLFAALVGNLPLLAVEVCVVETSGAPVAAARVALGQVHCTTTGDGCCQLDTTASGKYLVELGKAAIGVRVLEPGDDRVTLELAETVFDEVLVHAASRHAERLVEAPAAVAVVGEEDLERRGALGQVPRLLAVAPGVELAQAGLWDYNFNVRGFGGSTNRRVLVLLDGRDPSQAIFAGAQEWAGLSLDELESGELVYGPTAALYGAGAFNAVLDLRTKRIRDLAAHEVKLGLGELSSRSASARLTMVGTKVGDFRIRGSFEQSDDFVRSRTAGGEYPGLPPEIVEPSDEPIRISSFGARWDRDLAGGLLTIEGEAARVEGTTVVTGLGRLERSRVDKPWGRVAFETPKFAIIASHTERDSEEELSLASDSGIVLAEQRSAVEAQGNLPFWEDRGLLIGGVSWTRLEVDSANRLGIQTLLPEPVSSRHGAAFAQAQVDLHPRIRAVASLRYDDSNLHDSRVSPRAAVVVALSEASSLRLSWGEGFLSPTLSEKYLQLAVAPPINLGPLEAALAPLLGGVSLGLDAVPLLAVGNQDLDTEDNETFELGWTGVLGNNVAVSATAWRAELQNFTSNLLPVVGTSLGILGNYERWQAPASLDPATAQTVEAVVTGALPGLLLARDAAGNAYIPLLSFASFGRVDTEGLELGAQWAHGRWRAELSYSYFDAEVRAEVAEIPLSPNRPQHQAALGAGWLGEVWTVDFSLRWNEAFDYRSGIFAGPVDDGVVADLSAGWIFSPRLRVDLAISNVLDRSYAESFGGDLLGRRAVVRLTARW